MRFEGFDASFSSSFHPLTHRSFADSQGHRDVLLWPALLFQLPGLFPSFFSPIGFLWCSHTSYRITLYFLLPLSVGLRLTPHEVKLTSPERLELEFRVEHIALPCPNC